MATNSKKLFLHTFFCYFFSRSDNFTSRLMLCGYVPCIDHAIHQNKMQATNVTDIDFFFKFQR